MNSILSILIKDRKQQKIKANKVAEFIGISPALLSRLETGKSIPNLNYIEQMADYLGYELRLLKK